MTAIVRTLRVCIKCETLTAMPRKRRPEFEATKSRRNAQNIGRKLQVKPNSTHTIDIQKSPKDTQLAIRALMRQARAARTDLSAFYQFVIRHETTKQPLKVAPHQEVMFAFEVAHHQCVVRQPIGTGKTFGIAALALWLMGQDRTQRGAIVSKIQAQSSKVLRMISEYITEPELAARLTMVFPHLKRGTRTGDAWTQTAITVDRPAGIRDASAVSVGLDGAIGGARLSWLLGDDILDVDNTLTPAAREQVNSRFDGRILSRLDPTGARAVVTNTPWNREDLTFQLEAAGWPTLVMDIYGFIKFTNVDPDWIESLGLVRPSKKREGWWRLTKHDPDPEEVKTLWPERYSQQTIADLRRIRMPHEFARLYMCQPFDEGAVRCRPEWIEACKARGRGQWKPGTPIRFDNSNPIYTGVDLAVGTTEKHDQSAFVTYELHENGDRRLIDVEFGRWSGPDIMHKVIEKHDKFGGLVAVEDNSGQDFIRQFSLEKRKDLRVRAHNTNPTNKHHLDFGVESVFTEMKQGAWIFPCDTAGNCPPEFEKLFEECKYYQPPPAHTGDLLMAMWIAREASRRGGGGRDPKPTAGLRMQFTQGGSF